VARLLAVAAAAVLLVGAAPPRPGAVAPNASPRVARALAERYAPLLRLDPAERWGPTRVEGFLRHAALVRAPGGCYRHAGVRADERARGPAGFALRLDSAYDPGSTGPAPLYDGVRVTTRGLTIAYWAFYARSAARHAGDWERVVVELSLDLAPRGVRYAGGPLVPWRRVPLAAGGHPVVDVALGTHAPRPAAGAPRAGGRAIVFWHRGGLVTRRSQPWWGYGGAWGGG
jgi:hypothetical protein